MEISLHMQLDLMGYPGISAFWCLLCMHVFWCIAINICDDLCDFLSRLLYMFVEFAE